MTDCCTPKGYRTIFSEKSAHSEAKRYRRKGLDRTSRRIADLLGERGVEGRTLLEVGGGIGAIQIELLKAGVTRATNVELTPTYEDAAAELVRVAGLTDRVERKVMDFAEGSSGLAPADFVVMNRVICCYPDMPKLAAAAAEQARMALVLSFPSNHWWTRLGMTVVNFGFRVFRVQFQVYLHSPSAILATIERHGFTTRFNKRGLIWQLAALERTG